MKRVAIWAFYAVGAVAIGYLALFAYAVFTGRDLSRAIRSTFFAGRMHRAIRSRL